MSSAMQFIEMNTSLPCKYVIAPLCRMFCLLMMHMQADIDHNNLGLANGRVPPTWAVEQDRRYPLRHYAEDLRLWCSATDLIEERRGPAAVLRLSGAARSIMRSMPVNMLSFGRPGQDAQGNQIVISGIECLIRALEQRYGALDQETQIFSVSELMTFSRGPNETTDEMVARFDTILFRADQIAGIAFPPVIRSWIVLTHLRINKHSWPTVLAQTQGMLPVTEQQYIDMIAYVRRNSHLHESSRDVSRTLNQPYFGNITDGDDNASNHPYSSHASYPVDFTSYADDDNISWHSWSTGNSDPEEELDWDDTPADLPEDELHELLYLQYRAAKRKFRTFGQKRGRRFGTRRKGSGKGSGKFKGKNKSFFADPSSPQDTSSWPETSAYPSFSSSYDDPHATVFFKGSKGKGKGRGNPIGKDGKQMLCSLCHSPEHFWRTCPQAAAKGKGKGSSSFPSYPSARPKAKAIAQAPSSSSASSGPRNSMFFAHEVPEEVQSDSKSIITFSDGSPSVELSFWVSDASPQPPASKSSSEQFFA